MTFVFSERLRIRLGTAVYCRRTYYQNPVQTSIKELTLLGLSVVPVLLTRALDHTEYDLTCMCILQRSLVHGAKVKPLCCLSALRFCASPSCVLSRSYALKSPFSENNFETKAHGKVFLAGCFVSLLSPQKRRHKTISKENLSAQKRL